MFDPKTLPTKEDLDNGTLIIDPQLIQRKTEIVNNLYEFEGMVELVRQLKTAKECLKALPLDLENEKYIETRNFIAKTERILEELESIYPSVLDYYENEDSLLKDEIQKSIGYRKRQNATIANDKD